MHWEARFQFVAASHHGLIAKFHLPEIECTSDHWWRAIRSGRWHREGRRVLRSGGAAPTLEQRVLAALLDASPGAVLHGPSALAYQGLRGYNLADIHVARARDISGAPAELARLHELRALRAHHVTVVRGIVTETALRLPLAPPSNRRGAPQLTPPPVLEARICSQRQIRASRMRGGWVRTG